MRVWIIAWFCIIWFVSIIFYFIFILGALFRYNLHLLLFIIYEIRTSSFKCYVWKHYFRKRFSCRSMGRCSIISKKFIKFLLPIFVFNICCICKTLLIILLKFSIKLFPWGYAGIMGWWINPLLHICQNCHNQKVNEPLSCNFLRYTKGRKYANFIEVDFVISSSINLEYSSI